MRDTIAIDRKSVKLIVLEKQIGFVLIAAVPVIDVLGSPCYHCTEVVRYGASNKSHSLTDDNQEFSPMEIL